MLCPIKMHALLNRLPELTKETVQELSRCSEKDCVWWDETQCILLSIAEMLSNLNEAELIADAIDGLSKNKNRSQA